MQFNRLGDSFPCPVSTVRRKSFIHFSVQTVVQCGADRRMKPCAAFGDCASLVCGRGGLPGQWPIVQSSPAFRRGGSSARSSAARREKRGVCMHSISGRDG